MAALTGTHRQGVRPGELSETRIGIWGIHERPVGQRGVVCGQPSSKLTPGPQRAAESHFQCWAARLSAPRGAPVACCSASVCSTTGALTNYVLNGAGHGYRRWCRSEHITQHPTPCPRGAGFQGRDKQSAKEMKSVESSMSKHAVRKNKPGVGGGLQF